MTRFNLHSHRIVKHDVIALCGAKGSGKDSFFNLWTSKPIYPTRNIKFADTLNKIIDEVLGKSVEYADRDKEVVVDVQTLRGVLDREVGEGFGAYIDIATPKVHMSWRELAEWLGTNIIRKHDKDYHVRLAESKIDDAITDKDIAFLTDVRFENEVALASLAIFFKRDEDTRIEFDSATHEAEKLGEYIAVWSNRYLACRDQGQEDLAKYCLGMLKEGVDIKVHEVYQTMLDADGVLMFKPIQEAYRCFEFEQDVRDKDWFVGE